MRFLLFLCLLRGMFVYGSLIAASQLLVLDFNMNASLKLQDLTHSTARFSAARPGSVLKRGEMFPPRAPVPPNPLNFLDPVDFGNPENFATLNGPMLRSNWDDHCIEKLRTKRAFLEALQLARTALDYMERSNILGVSYQRYFDAESFTTVFEVLKSVFNTPDAATGHLLGGAANPVFQLLDLRYDVPHGYQGWSDTQCSLAVSPHQLAFLVQGANMGPTITLASRGLAILCPYAFSFPDLPLHLNELTVCTELLFNPYAQYSMWTLSSAILHELMHYNVMTLWIEGLYGQSIVGYNAIYDPLNTDNDPVDRYGAYNAVRLKARGRNPHLNADSYVWFALEVFWQSHCGLSFDDPPGPASDGNLSALNPDSFILPDEATHK